MTKNPVLEELREAREKILADWNGDTSAYLRDAQARLEKSGRTVWQGKQRTNLGLETAGGDALKAGRDGNGIDLSE